MQVTVTGTGYVGLVTGACLADLGNHAMCLDVDAHKVALLNAGQVPIYEPDLNELIQDNVAAGRLSFTTGIKGAVQFGDIQFDAVGTPANEDGSADLRQVMEAARNIGRHIEAFKVTECKAYRSPNLPALKRAMKQAVVFDGRNLYEPTAMKAAGFSYFGIGRNTD